MARSGTLRGASTELRHLTLFAVETWIKMTIDSRCHCGAPGPDIRATLACRFHMRASYLRALTLAAIAHSPGAAPPTPPDAPLSPFQTTGPKGGREQDKGSASAATEMDPRGVGATQARLPLHVALPDGAPVRAGLSISAWPHMDLHRDCRGDRGDQRFLGCALAPDQGTRPGPGFLVSRLL